MSAELPVAIRPIPHTGIFLVLQESQWATNFVPFASTRSARLVLVRPSGFLRVASSGVEFCADDATRKNSSESLNIAVEVDERRLAHRLTVEL